MSELSQPNSANIWDYKPRWCQPWSIILTGITLVTGTWFLTNIIWLTLLISSLMVAWWGYFLVIYPRMFKQYIESQIAETKMTTS
ncbi:MAG: DUF6737 family protein [Cyanobacteria bacterium P01_G01_bin.49]